jgi:ribosomal protein S18 acetylase RimI-like enzyme
MRGQLSGVAMTYFKLSVSALAVLSASAGVALARDNVQISGSSTVLPYATIVAEAFGENFEFPTPVVEGGGSGAGRKKMCEGVGETTIDIANSSSRISQSDIELCAANGVTDIMEVRFGYDGIVFASKIDGAEFAFTPAHWYNALAAEVLKDGALVAFCKLRYPTKFVEHSDARNPIELGQLSALPGYTGAGVGAILMDWALGTARDGGHDAILLSVYAENFGAQRFYQRHGFGKIADITFRVGEHLDPEFLYELKL